MIVSDDRPSSRETLSNTAEQQSIPSLPCITYHDVYLALAELDPNKALGVYAIGPKVLKYCALALYIPIHHLFTLCLSLTSIPYEWKYIALCLFLNLVTEHLFQNYRPISLLCTISKVLETIIYDPQ